MTTYCLQHIFRMIVLILLLSNSAEGGTLSSPTQNLPPKWPWHAINLQLHNSSPDDIRRFHGKLGINMVNLGLTARKFAEQSHLNDKDALQAGLKWADQMLDVCAELGITAVLDISHFPVDPSKPGQTTPAFWGSSTARRDLVLLTARIAEHFKNRGSELAAYSFMSEPVLIEKGGNRKPPEWQALLQSIVSSVRSIDQARWIVVAPGPWGGPDGYKDFTPPVGSRLIWGVHMYQPHSFTHQGIKSSPLGVEYPGWITMRKWDRTALVSALKPLRDFQKKHNGPVFVGEFSATRWAPGGEQYIFDLASIFDEFGWGWAYFSGTGWHGWNPDYNNHIADNANAAKQRVGESSPRWQTLRKIFRKPETADGG